MTYSVSVSSLQEKRQLRDGLPADLLRLFQDPGLATPHMLLDRGEVAANLAALRTALPRANIHYAVKPNNHPAIIDEVHRAQANFDVCSLGEIEAVLRTGIDPASLVHSHPVKSLPEFDGAVKAGVEMFVVDNIDEVRKLRRYDGRKLRVLIRFRITNSAKAVVNLQYKYGCLPEEVLPLAEAVGRTGHGVYGLCFHVGSQCLQVDNHLAAIETAGELFGALTEAGFEPRLLDIGGGFPVRYLRPVPSIEDFCRPIRTALDKHISPSVGVVSEPGRFIAATPVTLVTSIIGKAVRDGKIWYYLDDGLYSTFSGIVYDHCRYPVVTQREGERRRSVLAGPTCDSFDVMYDGLMLPEHEVGDRIVFLATGAYCAVSASDFNALKRPDCQVVG